MQEKGLETKKHSAPNRTKWIPKTLWTLRKWLGVSGIIYSSIEAGGVLSDTTLGPLSRPNALLRNRKFLKSWVSQR